MRSVDPFRNLSTDQLAYIGAIAMLYNDAEDVVDDLCGAGLHIPIRDKEVLSRINGIDGKIELIKLCAKQWGFDAAEQAFLASSLGDAGFKQLKKWRDAVVHARLLDRETSIARVYERRGAVAEVLLSLDALKGLFARLDLMKVELYALTVVTDVRSKLIRDGDRLEPEHKERLEREDREWWVRARSHQTQRLSLPPMPEFPGDTE